MKRDNDVMVGGVGGGDNGALDKSGVTQAEYPIHILHDDDEAAVDIVAVHGLGANPNYAWIWLPKNNPPDNPNYPDKPLNWLKDLLPSKLLSSKLPCRVMAFNYSSKWFLDAPQVRLSNISDNLLDSLRNNRTKVGLHLFDYQEQVINNPPKATNRPLIFIGHSFGGNLIEQVCGFLNPDLRSAVLNIRQAIVSSRLYSEYMHIAESTVGVIFLGTPHRGCEAAKWGVLIASLGGLLGSTEKRILEDLQQQSGTLTDRLHDFSSWLFSESVPVVCYWEQLETDYSTRAGPLRFMKSMLKEVVVDETSACIDGHKKISLHTDHFKINKFYGPGDPSFLRVYPEIVRMAKGAEEMLKRRRNPKAIPDDRNAQPELLKFLRALKVMNAKDILSDIKRRKGGRVGNTCEWILKREEFSAWGASTDPQLFFITGSPGIGKTMMSTFLVDELQKKVERAPGKALAYFFCDDKDQDRKTPIAILRSLIWQILLQRNELFDNIKPDFDAQGNTIIDSFSTLWRVFKGMLRDERSGEVFILIDAFDECEKSMRKGLLSCIRELFQSSLTVRTRKLKFLVTSRPENDILEELGDVGTRLLMNSTSVNYDLSIYIDSEVDRLAKRKRYSPKLKEMVEDALKNEADGTFLWVSLMVADLEKEHNYNVKDKLKLLPKGLNETYAQILNQNITREAREDVQFLLLSMVAARRPLRKMEMASAFAVWKHGLVLSSQDVEEYTDICLSCSSIIYLDGVTISFCHQSVKDFLLDDHDGLQRAWYHTSRDCANLLLFQVCWNYISLGDLYSDRLVVFYARNRDVRGLLDEEKLNLRFRGYPLLEYACTEWEEHAIASTPALFDTFRIGSPKEPVASYPNVLRRLTIALREPTLANDWLLRAAREGQEEIVSSLYGQVANINVRDIYGMSPLSWAVKNGHEGVTRLLLDRGKVETDSREMDGRSLLSLAAENGHEATAKLLFTGKVEVNSRDRHCLSPLSLAASNGHEGITRLLLDIDSVEADSRSIYGQSPLSLAAENGHEATVKLLLDTGKVEVNSRDRHCLSPLSLAASNGHEGITRLLLDIDSVEADSRSIYGQSPLSLAAENGHEATVKLLLDTGKVEVNSRDRHCLSPLSLAASNGHEGITRLLLDIDSVEADLRSIYGQSPLSLAAEYGHEATVKLLLDTGEVEANSRGNFGQSPLYLAAEYGHEATVKLLLDTGKVEVNSGDNDGRSPLSRAASGGRESVVKLLLNTGNVEADLRDNGGRSPLQYAIMPWHFDDIQLCRHKAVVRLLLDTGKVESVAGVTEFLEKPSPTMETKTLPLTANVARILLLLRSLQRGRHNLDDPWIVLPLQLHEYDDLLLRIDKNETLWEWMECKSKLVYNSSNPAVSNTYAYYPMVSYDSRTSTFVIRRPTAMHESFKCQVVSWIQQRLRTMAADSDAQSRLFAKGIFSAGSATLRIKPPGKERVIIRHDPDSQFKYTRKYWPPVVFELANSPGPKSLSCLASDYILESRGNIRAFVGFEFHMETKKVTLTVCRPLFFIHPEKGLPGIDVQSETQILRDEQGTPNPAKGSGLRLMLHDFAPKDLFETVDRDTSLLINSAKLCKILGEVEESERMRAQGPMFTAQEMNLILGWRCERTPEPVYEEDGFVFGVEELSVHARFLDTPVDTGKVSEGDEKVDGGEVEE
ncbi:hypothetical protein V501_03452 [Pseudogymnoascus sp. VKM F-4519 (FW-2642)]|nr:hypothetical protein V501_03452 [Pseudogymnoascus sp. VKM F-4519 (FW-2642)]